MTRMRPEGRGRGSGDELNGTGIHFARGGVVLACAPGCRAASSSRARFAADDVGGVPWRFDLEDLAAFKDSSWRFRRS